MAELNLIPQHLKQRKEQNSRLKQYIALGAAGLCILLLLIYLPYLNYSRQKNQELFYKGQLDAANGEKIEGELKNITDEINSYNLYIEKVNKLAGDKTFVSERILELQNYVPINIVFDSFTYNDKSIVINGTSDSLQGVSDFAAKLEMARLYSNVEINSIVSQAGTVSGGNGGEKGYRFTVTLTY